MPLLSGSVTASRYHVVSRPPELEFDSLAFKEIAPGSEVREKIGFVPMEPEAEYQVGHSRFAFRVRLDTLKADPTAVRERVKELVKTELETTGAPYVGPKKRKKLRELAEEELIMKAVPRSKIIEGAIDGEELYVATTAKAFLGRVLILLRQLGVVVEPGAPWARGEMPEVESELVEAREEDGQSVLGCRFLRSLLDDRELFLEPESGAVRLQTREARVSLTGAVLPEVLRYAERDVELLAAKLTTGEVAFRFDGLNYSVSGLRIETARHDHWSELLDERLEGLTAVWELLDRKFAEKLDQMARA